MKEPERPSVLLINTGGTIEMVQKRKSEWRNQ